jgi:hypothetical protein
MQEEHKKLKGENEVLQEMLRSIKIELKVVRAKK